MKVENPVFEEARQVFERGDVVDGGREAAFDEGARAGGERQRLACARARAP